MPMSCHHINYYLSSTKMTSSYPINTDQTTYLPLDHE